MEFAIATTSAYDRTVVAVSGELDLESAERLASAMDAAVRGGDREVHVDMSAVTFIDSSGLRCLIGAYKELTAADRVFRVVNPSRAVVRLLDTTGQLERFS